MNPSPIAVSMGDPAGIGLEIAARAAAHARDLPPFFLIADADAFDRAAQALALPITTRRVATAAEAGTVDGALAIVHTPLTAPAAPGRPDPRNAAAVTGAIEQGVAAIQSGAASALVTLPIAKAPLYEAGFPFPGHTEFLAHLTAPAPMEGERGPVMMLATAGLRVALATIHAPLGEISAMLTTRRIVSVARVVAQSLRRDFGVEKPRIALAGLNPHAGEGGAIGREEIEIINPAAEILRQEGHDVRDAAPADTLFHAEARAGYDAIIAMYHDQALIPIKTLDFWGAVNVTLGLPIIRTSPDHGTGFDIAGKNLARPDSFIAALRMASDMAARRG